MLFGDNSGYVGALGRSTKVSFNWVVKRQERTKDELILWKEEVKKKKKKREYIEISCRRDLPLTSHLLSLTFRWGEYIYYGQGARSKVH